MLNNFETTCGKGVISRVIWIVNFVYSSFNIWFISLFTTPLTHPHSSYFRTNTWNILQALWFDVFYNFQLNQFKPELKLIWWILSCQLFYKQSKMMFFIQSQRNWINLTFHGGVMVAVAVNWYFKNILEEIYRLLSAQTDVSTIYPSRTNHQTNEAFQIMNTFTLNERTNEWTFVCLCTIHRYFIYTLFFLTLCIATHNIFNPMRVNWIIYTPFHSRQYRIN